MERGKEYFRETLLEIEQDAKPLEFYDISSVMIKKGYDMKSSFVNLLLMEDSELFNKVAKDNSFNFR